MRIRNVKTIAEYKEVQKKHIQNWIDNNFLKGSVVWEMNGASQIKITDTKGESIIIALEDID